MACRRTVMKCTKKAISCPSPCRSSCRNSPSIFVTAMLGAQTVIHRMVNWCPPACPPPLPPSSDPDCEPPEEVPGCNCPPNPAKYLGRLKKIQEMVMCAPATRVVVALLACRALLQALGVQVCFMNSM